MNTPTQSTNEASGKAPVTLDLTGVPIVHLTLTGVQAGRPLCDCDKGAELARGAKFWHATYAPDAIFTHEKLCPKCKAEWDQAV